MFRITYIFVVICFGFCSIVLGQDGKNYKKASTIYFKKDSNISRIKINHDTTEAFFRIVHEGMETQEKRNEAVKIYKEKGLPFPVFYTTFTSVSSPKKIYSLEHFEYITVTQFRKENYILPSTVYIIQKLENGSYLMWETMMWAQE